MYNKKSLVIIISFIGLCFWLVFISITARSRQLNSEQLVNESTVEKSEFQNVHYFRAVNNIPDFELKSSDLKIVNQALLNFDEPNGVLFNDGKPISYTASKGHMNQHKKLLTLNGDVVLTDADSSYSSDNLTYNGSKGTMQAIGNVKSSIYDEKSKDTMKIRSNELRSNLNSKIATFSGKVIGEIKRKKRYEGGIKFMSEIMNFNSLESQILLDKFVEIHRNDYFLKAGSAEIFLENFNKKLKYYTLYDDVKLEEKITLSSGKEQIRRAYAEKLEAHQKESKIILTGAPRVEQGDDIIKGYQITLKENVELVEVDDAKSSFSLKKDKNE